MNIELWNKDSDIPFKKGEIHIASQPSAVSMEGKFYILKKFPEYHQVEVHYLSGCGCCGKPTDYVFCDVCKETERQANKDIK